MAKSSNSIKPNLSLHNTKVILSLCTVLEAYQNYHGYVVKVNAKNCATYGDLVYIEVPCTPLNSTEQLLNPWEVDDNLR